MAIHHRSGYYDMSYYPVEAATALYDGVTRRSYVKGIGHVVHANVGKPRGSIRATKQGITGTITVT